jgi:protein KRI1
LFGPDKKVDEEDELRENEMDVYEAKYNFRFEDPNAATITSHARDAGAEESLRRPDDIRKQARERQKERKEDLKRQKKEELA